MHIEEVRRLVRLVEESDIDELDVWKWWGRIKIRKSALGAPSGVVSAPAPAAPPPVAPAPAVVETAEPAQADADEGLTPINSPMVGTFYSAPAPDSPTFVKVGDRVEVGQTVCIIEAMKLMNEIQAEVGGTVKKILVENASPIEFGQPLFLIQED